MKIEEESIPALQNYLVRQLEPICAAEPKVLATYVIALLRHDESREKLEHSCVEELEDFLKEETKNFVSQLFANLKEDPKTGKTELREVVEPEQYGAVPSPQREEDEEDKESRMSRGRDSDSEGRRKREEDPRKRRRDDRYKRERDTGGEEDDRRSYKRHDRFESTRGFEGRRGDLDGGRRKPGPPPIPPQGPPPGSSGRGRFNDRPAFLERGKVQRCRDYEERGYCMKGELCPYDHGSGFVVTDVHGLEKLRNEEGGQGQRKDISPYDPAKPLSSWDGSSSIGNIGGPSFMNIGMNPGVMDGSAPLGSNMMSGLPSTAYDIPDSEENLIQVGGRGMYPKRDRDSRDRDGRPPFDRNRGGAKGRPAPMIEMRNTLVIAGIPDELNNIERLNAHFKQFGNILNIQVRSQESKACVQFSENFEAQAALNSPEAVLGNRFIRVFWANRMNLEKDFSFMVRKGEFAPPESRPPRPEPRVPHSYPPPSQATRVSDPEKPKLDVEKLKKEKEGLRKQQLEQTKSLLASLEKMKTVDKSVKLELMKRIESLTNNVSSSLKKDSAVVAAKTATEKAKQDKANHRKNQLDKEMETIKEEAKKAEAKIELQKEIKAEETKEPGTQAETVPEAPETKSQEIQRLQRRYESLKNMASSMGIDATTPTGKRTHPQGTKPPRKKRAMVLDNRTTEIKITNLPENLRTDALLSEHLKEFGPLTSVSIEQGDALVKFENRRAAEAAMLRGKGSKEHPLEMKWYDRRVARSVDKTADTEENVVEEVYRVGGEDEEEEGSEDEERSWKR